MAVRLVTIPLTSTSTKLEMTSDVTGGVGDIGWRSSSRCAGGECIQVARREGEIIVRSSADPEWQLSLSLTEWHDFLAGVRAGDVDGMGEGQAD
jgi:Domain of unknown function (DUF397)